MPAASRKRSPAISSSPADSGFRQTRRRFTGSRTPGRRGRGGSFPRSWTEFLEAAGRPGTHLVAHNLDFDLGVVGSEIVRADKPRRFFEIPGLCTMKTTADLLRLPRWGASGYKWPTLEELHAHLFGQSYDRPHDAGEDLLACARCFFWLLKQGYYSLPDGS